MSKSFEKMSEEGIPKTKEPTDVAAPKMEQQDLLKLSAQEFRVYNRMSEHMDMFLTFRLDSMRTFDKLGTCFTKLVAVVDGLQGCRSANFWLLEMRSAIISLSITGKHRYTLLASETFANILIRIEEQHIFPVLAKKMACFKPDQELLTQHKGIHEGLDKFEAYVKDCKSGKRELRMEEMKEFMDGFGQVLWSHLDDEVKALRAENMRLYWSKEEMARLPM